MKTYLFLLDKQAVWSILVDKYPRINDQMKLFEQLETIAGKSVFKMRTPGPIETCYPGTIIAFGKDEKILELELIRVEITYVQDQITYVLKFFQDHFFINQLQDAASILSDWND